MTKTWKFKMRYGQQYRPGTKLWKAMHKDQGGRCKICGIKEENTNTFRLVVDHDHGTGAIRGLLCYACNSGLGMFKDSPSLLKKSAEYLESHKFCYENMI